MLPENVGEPHGSASPWPWAVPMLKRVASDESCVARSYRSEVSRTSIRIIRTSCGRMSSSMNSAGFVQARKDGKGRSCRASSFYICRTIIRTGRRRSCRTPSASVADNDLALGRVVDAVSHSAYWDDTAIFVVEDDAQDGADHVDAHRSTALVISKYCAGIE